MYILVYIDVLILCIYKDLQEYSLNTNRHIISERASEVRKIIINSIKSICIHNSNRHISPSEQVHVPPIWKLHLSESTNHITYVTNYALSCHTKAGWVVYMDT